MRLYLRSMLLLIGAGAFLCLNSCSKETLETPQLQQIEEVSDNTTSDQIRAPARSASARLSGNQVVPPIQTQARGRGLFQLVNLGARDIEGLSYNIQAINTSEVISVEMAHAPAGDNGPVIAILQMAPLDGNGLPIDDTISEGVITINQLTGPMEGDFDGFKTAIRNEEICILVKTIDNPSGEIRGQIIRQ